MRARLTDQEREDRRRARSRHSFSDAAYKHYDTSNGFGSAAEWIAAAEALSGGRAGLRYEGTTPRSQDQIDLALFSLDAMPSDIGKLKSAFRNSMFVYHPDHGGTTAEAQAALAAFSRLKEHY